MNWKLPGLSTLAAAFAVAAVLAAPAGAVTPTVIYNAIPATLPPNVASLGFEATSTSQFGDYVHLAGTDRILGSVTVTMSDWALYADYATDARYSGNTAVWSHPITLNVYSNHLGANGAPDTLLATTTRTITIPWRPVADLTCAGGTAWRAADGNCYNGIAFNAMFDLSTPSVTLPNDVIVGVAYNTADYGAAPLHLAGPYNSLNVGAPSGQTASVGTDDSADSVFWNTSFAGFYADRPRRPWGFPPPPRFSSDSTVPFHFRPRPPPWAPRRPRPSPKKGRGKNFTNPPLKKTGGVCASAKKKKKKKKKPPPATTPPRGIAGAPGGAPCRGAIFLRGVPR